MPAYHATGTGKTVTAVIRHGCQDLRRTNTVPRPHPRAGGCVQLAGGSRRHGVSDAIYWIDEPETHMHTKLQGKVLREQYNLIPGPSQLWVSTHSIGMLQEADDIEKENPGTVAFSDFDARNFDDEQIICPAHIGKAVMDKFYELAFGDFAKLMLPKKIVFCEGNPNGISRKDYDKNIFAHLFGDTHPDAFFISGGSCSELESIETK